MRTGPQRSSFKSIHACILSPKRSGILHALAEIDAKLLQDLDFEKDKRETKAAVENTLTWRTQVALLAARVPPRSPVGRQSDRMKVPDADGAAACGQGSILQKPQEQGTQTRCVPTGRGLRGAALESGIVDRGSWVLLRVAAGATSLQQAAAAGCYRDAISMLARLAAIGDRQRLMKALGPCICSALSAAPESKSQTVVFLETLALSTIARALKPPVRCRCRRLAPPATFHM